MNGLADMAANLDGGITAEGDNLAIWCKAGAEMIFGHDLAEEPVRPTGAESLTDPGLLRRALTVAERYWHLAARRDLRAGNGGDALGRWNSASGAALDLVEVYAVGMAADALLAACARVSDPFTRAVLEDLSALFLLRQVERPQRPAARRTGTHRRPGARPPASRPRPHDPARPASQHPDAGLRRPGGTPRLAADAERCLTRLSVSFDGQFLVQG